MYIRDGATGLWQPALGLSNGKQRISASSYLYDIAEGDVPDHTSINKFGHNPAVAAALETVR